ncbi:hypothetical protein ENBRE01_0204 [Enteropsectra breve]|nr:hypothetical protein ENBRE01_0204 [Enteropsectra breve]
MAPLKMLLGHEQTKIVERYFKALDSTFSHIREIIRHVVVYSYASKWIETETEGTLYVYTTANNKNIGMLLSSKNLENFIICSNKHAKLEKHPNFLIISTVGSKNSHGLWFKKDEDAQIIFDFLNGGKAAC